MRQRPIQHLYHFRQYLLFDRPMLVPTADVAVDNETERSTRLLRTAFVLLLHGLSKRAIVKLSKARGSLA